MTEKSLAALACRPEQSRGRRYPAETSQTRSDFQRDRDRILHAGAFRKLQYKTQVFVIHEGDYYRTRLTHSLEVAQIARSIARALELNEDLAEACALAHDLGHPPFSHAGEDALHAAMEPYGGFDHNEQTFRIVTELERLYAAYDGLNLTWETLEGIVKHNGPLGGARQRPVRASIAAFDAEWSLELGGFPSAEAQVAALADDIAYNSHDVDDGLRAGLFSVSDLECVPGVGDIFAQLRGQFPDLAPRRLRYEGVRRMITLLVDDLIAETRRRAIEAGLDSPDAVRTIGRPVVGFSEPLREQEKLLRAFLFERMYRHFRVNRTRRKARQVVRDLFECYLAEPECLPDEWRDRAENSVDKIAAARLVGDYIAGMTDSYALKEHKKLFDLYSIVDT
ncbi:deoxyguanosinetriphosphate triphosphohydrolase [Limibacillus sp. MBR-115]|jgi:dGTPase|uniref:deoxyguanosinetriphosphate triphosphohydrolase n=1 Tax=Limibacillus sp. MBR-115 TaxID=3156465 RepID=UPI003398AFBD